MDERGGGDMTTEAEVEGGHKSRDADSHQKLEEAENGFSSRVPRGSGARLRLELLAFKVEVRE